MAIRDITSKNAKSGFYTTALGYDLAVSHDGQVGYSATISVSKGNSTVLIGVVGGRNVKELQSKITGCINDQDYTPKGVRGLIGDKNGTHNLSDLVKPTREPKQTGSILIETPRGRFASITAAAKWHSTHYSVVKNRVESQHEIFADWKYV